MNETPSRKKKKKKQDYYGVKVADRCDGTKRCPVPVPKAGAEKAFGKSVALFVLVMGVCMYSVTMA